MTEMLPPVEGTRRFSQTRRVRLGDAGVDGRLRLDAIARYLQDIAADDAAEARLPRDRGWVVRRVAMRVLRRPSLYEDVGLETFCAGTGGRWAERRTTLRGARGVGERGVCVETASTWVYVDLTTGSPVPLPPEFFALYGAAAAERRISARLRHPGPPPGVGRERFVIRAVDFDVLGHVNNAVYWAPVEERLPGFLAGRPLGDAEMEFRGGVDPGEDVELAVESADALHVWFLVGGEVRASARVEVGEG